MTERITEDVYMLTNLTTYMDITMEYAKSRYSANITQTLKQAQEMLKELIAVLANMTGIDVQEIFSPPAFYSGADSSSTEDTTMGVTDTREVSEWVGIY